MWTLRLAESGTIVPCEVARMTFQEIAAAAASWGREFQRRRVGGVRDEDALIWARGFMSDSPSEGDCKLTGYVISVAGDIQGIVRIDDVLRPSRTQPSVGMVYIRYLATAPWNRRCDEYLGRYRGIGRLLVAQAAMEGITLGGQGHIGLHSFVAATPFYDRLGFKNLGADPCKRGMSYFELLPDAATALIAKLRR